MLLEKTILEPTATYTEKEIERGGGEREREKERERGGGGITWTKKKKKERKQNREGGGGGGVEKKKKGIEVFSRQHKRTTRTTGNLCSLSETAFLCSQSIRNLGRGLTNGAKDRGRRWAGWGVGD